MSPELENNLSYFQLGIGPINPVNEIGQAQYNKASSLYNKTWSPLDQSKHIIEPALAPEPSDGGDKVPTTAGTLSTGTIILMVVAGIVLVVLLVLLGRYVLKKRGDAAGSSLAYTDVAIN